MTSAPSAHDALISGLLTAIDDRDWPLLAGLVTADIRYDRPGYPTISGVHDLLHFYRHTRIIADGKHQLERVLTGDEQGFCWGTFEGVSKSGLPLNETFADWYEFTGNRVSRRRSFFYRPAI